LKSSSIRLVLADVDGTLVTNDKVLTDRAVAAVRKLGEAGILFAVTSGRPPKGMSMLIEPLDITTPIAAFNGGLLVNRDMSVIEQRVLPEELVKPVSELFGSFGLDTWVYQGADWYVPDPKGSHVARESATVKFEPKVMTSLDGLTKDIAKLVGVSDDLDARPRQVRRPRDRIPVPALLPGRHPPGRQQGRGRAVPVEALFDPGRGHRDDRRHAERRADVRPLGALDRDGQREPRGAARGPPGHHRQQRRGLRQRDGAIRAAPELTAGKITPLG
jgi:hypothetical protein